MAVLTLAPRLDLSQARPLADALRQHRGAPLELDASAVQHLGALGLQALLCAARDWRVQGLPLTITQSNETFDTALAQMGVALDDLQSQEAA
ncbi:MAG: STAS domain-containing protein [Paracoccaceae bacterium]|jgi:chemotaxis protein CheX